MSAPTIDIIGDQLSVQFNRFDGESYRTFLKVKALPEYRLQTNLETLTYTITAPARFAPMLGVALPVAPTTDLPLSHFLMDDQAAIVQLAWEGKRFGVFSDCGLGKTLIGLDWSRRVVHRTRVAGVGGRVLIVTLNEIVQQWIDEAAKFYGEALPIVRLESREELKEWCRYGTINGQLTPAAIAVVNYEKFNYRGEAEQVISELKYLAGIVLDEASRLKTGGGRQKWAVIKSARGIEYKLSLTATPAPNEIMEFASQAAFLEKMRDVQEIIWTYFTRDEKTHRWTVKPHARQAFYAFLAGWSIYVRDPRRYGWRMNVEPPPPPTQFVHTIATTDEQRQLIMDVNSDPRNVSAANAGTMFVGELNAIAANKLSQAAKGFIYQKGQLNAGEEARGNHRSAAGTGERRGSEHICIAPHDIRAAGAAETDGVGESGRGIEDARGSLGSERRPAGVRKDYHQRRNIRAIDSHKPPFVADLIIKEWKAGHQVLVWTVFDAETEILAELLRADKRFAAKSLKHLDVLTGKTPAAERESILTDFRAGKSRVLVSRASMLGFGMNFQMCTSMVFNGWTFSYEQFYQAVRRAYRHGQTKSVRVHIPVIPELEGQMWDAIGRKQTQHEEAIAEMESLYISARAATAAAANPNDEIRNRNESPMTNDQMRKERVA